MQICGGDQAVGATEQTCEKPIVWACVVWTARSKLYEISSTQRAKMESDAHVAPSTPVDDIANYRSRFVNANPDIVLLHCKESLKKFVGSFNGDFMINSIV